MGGPFDPKIDELPHEIAVFPLTGALLLPGGRLPLNIFEPRYLAMVSDALTTRQRMIGMVQPSLPTPEDNRGSGMAGAGGDAPDIYRTGCAGRITSFEETPDRRYQLTLTGIIRFEAGEELAPRDGYRRFAADYSKYHDDLGDAPEGVVDRDRLFTALRAYFLHAEIPANWDVMEETPSEYLITSLAMSCPFNPPERQALLEAPGLAERARIFVVLLEMAVTDGAGGAGGADARTDH